jgi:hypothetical protein
MHKKLVLAVIAISIVLLSATVVQLVNKEANPPSKSPLIMMPEEYLNYTITTINGSLWAKIDGTYPLHVLFWQGALPMLYPTPPGTTNISLKMDETELKWDNFTEIYPEAVHFNRHRQLANDKLHNQPCPRILHAKNPL